MGVRLKTVGGNVNWLQPYMMAAQITAHSNDALAQAFASGGQAIGSALRHNKDVAHEDTVRQETWDHQDTIRTEENTRRDRYHADEMSLRIADDSRQADALSAQLLGPLYKQQLTQVENLQARLGAGEPVGEQLKAAQEQLQSTYGSLNVVLQRQIQQRNAEIKPYRDAYQAKFGTDGMDVDAPMNPAEREAYNRRNPPAGSTPASPGARTEERRPGVPAKNLAKPALDAAQPKGPQAVDPSIPERQAVDLNDPAMRITQQIAEMDAMIKRKEKDRASAEKLNSPYLVNRANDAIELLNKGKAARELELKRIGESAKIAAEAQKARQHVRLAGEQAGLSEDEIIGYEAKATSLDAARLLAAGMKPKAAALTPEQRGRNAAAETIAREDALKAAGRGKPVKPVVDGEAKWQADQSAAALKKYEAQTRVYGDTPQVVRWDTFTTDELTAGMNDGSVAPDVRAQFRAEFDKRNAQSDAAGAIRSVRAPNPFGGGGAPTAPAPGGSDPKARASAEFDALPEAQQTRDAWVAIKRKHGL